MATKPALIARMRPVPVLRPACAALIAALVSAAALAAPVRAAAPEPRQPVDIARFIGRWFEVARTPNPREQVCVSASMDLAPARGGRLSVVQTCRKADPSASLQTVRAGARFDDGDGHTRFDVTFLGGLMRAHYRVLDHHAQYRWAVVSTSGGRYVWLFARNPHLSAASLKKAEASLVSLGYDPSRLVYPQG